MSPHSRSRTVRPSPGTSVARLVTAAVLGTLGVAPALHAQPPRCNAPRTATALARELSDSAHLYRGTLIESGNAILYFKKVSPRGEDYRIFLARRRGGAWVPSAPLAIGRDGVSDLYPTISNDGQRLVFASYRPLPGADSVRRNAHLWTAERQGAGWGAPAPLAEVNRPGLYHPGVLLRPDGSIRFTLIDPSARSASVMTSDFRNGAFAPPRPAADPPFWRSVRGDTAYWGGVLSPDGTVAVVGTARIDPATRRPGNGDALFSRLVNGAWTPLRPLGAGVNTASDENFFTFSPDGCTLLFTRDYTSFHVVSVHGATEGAATPLTRAAPTPSTTPPSRGSAPGS